MPTLINRYTGARIADIFAGYDFSVSISEKNLVWSWGDNSNYKCGIDLTIKGSVVPNSSTDLVCLNTKHVFTGINHMAVQLTQELNSKKKINK